MAYYDGTKLMSLKDSNGNTPEIFMCTTNRTGGKTTYYGRMIVNRFFKNKQKFALLYRFDYEIDVNVGEKFFKCLRELFFPGYFMTAKRREKGIYYDLFLNDEHCGYAIAINKADSIKKNSSLFSDVENIFFDEFQSETNHYCPDEVQKFRSIHTSIARGNGEQVRYVPVFMCANPVSLVNPYYVAMGISTRLTNMVKFLKGDGFVLEQGYNESASLAQKESGFNKAFGNDTYAQYAAQGIYLNDNLAFIENMSGNNRYLCTIKCDGVNYSIREYPEEGIIYCDTSFDNDFKLKITVTTDDHQVNYVMLHKNDFTISNFRYYFDHGCFRFKSLKAKEAIMKLLSY